MNIRGKVVVLCIALFCALTSPANAKSDDDRDEFISKKPMNLEELYNAKEYNEGIEKAIKQFERKFSTKVKLPETMPFKVNLSFGKVQDDHSLSLHFLGENKKDLFQLNVNPNIPFQIESNYTLNNGEKVFIDEVKHDPNVRQLYLRKNKFEYILSINNIEKYDQQLLIKVGESLK